MRTLIIFLITLLHTTLLPSQFIRKITLLDELELMTQGLSVTVTDDATVYIHKIPSPKPMVINLLAYPEWARYSQTIPEAFALSPQDTICSIANQQGFIVHIATANGCIIGCETIAHPDDYIKRSLEKIEYQELRNIKKVLKTID
jgi:hypothetical protein